MTQQIQSQETVTLEFLADLVRSQTCEETYGVLSSGVYLRCGKQAVAVIKNRDPRAYFMCTHCAWHNVKNRGAILWFTVERHLQEILRTDDNAA